jgi:uroporphyrinogen-III decarboxylase
VIKRVLSFRSEREIHAVLDRDSFQEGCVPLVGFVSGHDFSRAVEAHSRVGFSLCQGNAESKFGSVSDYERFTRPYDERVFEALAATRLTVLHLHYLERPYIDQFKDFNVPVVQYSVKTSGIPISEARKHFSQTIAGGADEIDFDKLTTGEMRKQWTEAREQAASKYIAAPGCSVPNNSTPDELARFRRSLGA